MSDVSGHRPRSSGNFIIGLVIIGLLAVLCSIEPIRETVFGWIGSLVTQRD